MIAGSALVIYGTLNDSLESEYISNTISLHKGIEVIFLHVVRNKTSCTISANIKVNENIQAFNPIMSNLPRMFAPNDVSLGFNFVGYIDAEAITPAYKFLFHGTGNIQPRKNLKADDTVVFYATYTCI